jgi:hypothetical protein
MIRLVKVFILLLLVMVEESGACLKKIGSDDQVG